MFACITQHLYLQREDALLSKGKFQKGIENEKQWEEGEESELQKCFNLEVIKLFILKSLLNVEDVVKTYCGRGKNV